MANNSHRRNLTPQFIDMISTMSTGRKPRRRISIIRTAIWAVTFAFLLTIGTMKLAQAIIDGNDGARIYDTVADVPRAPVAIVFGAGYFGNVLSPVLRDRVDTGVALYTAGKVPKLLMTGDNGHVGYSEPDAMKAAAVREGVPACDILCDYAGFHTYDSLYRARDLFGVNRAILVTQTYHLHRALYTGRKLGLDVSGISADRETYPDQAIYDRRELLSCVAAWMDVNVTHPRPKFLGPQVADLGG
jgi:SanA protein